MMKWQSRETIRKTYLDSLPPSELLHTQPYQYALRFGENKASPVIEDRGHLGWLNSDRPYSFDFNWKAGFRPTQPRWLRGNGKISGRWSGGAGTSEPGIGHNSKPRGGHHFVSRSVFGKRTLRPETRRVFEDSVTGPLRYERHQNSKEHDIYNRAVDELYDQFLAEKGIESEDMTPEQARELVDRVKRSSDARIRNLNLRIYRREILYWIRRIPVLRGSE